jgi:hypothetical protein
LSKKNKPNESSKFVKKTRKGGIYSILVGIFLIIAGGLSLNAGVGIFLLIAGVMVIIYGIYAFSIVKSYKKSYAKAYKRFNQGKDT